MQLIILGAGTPHRGDTPAALREPRAGTSMLQWLLDAADSNVGNALFVAGYQSEAIRTRYPDLNIILNPHWETSGSGESLLVAPLNTESNVLVTYSDIMFRHTVPKALAATKADIAVAWDSAWLHRYAGRPVDDLVRCEKVLVNGNKIERLGADLPVDWASGEFVGLVYFSAKAVDSLIALRDSGPKSLRTKHLSEHIEFLRGQGLSVDAVDVAGDWAEFNEPRDIAHFILGTKAETLSRLRGMVRHAVIQDQITCTVPEWQRNSSKVVQEVKTRFSKQLVVVRSSARSEDSFHASNAGGYDSVLHVDPESGLNAAVEQVILSYGEASADDQVLIQPMVSDVQISGVAFTRTLKHNAPWYVVNYETNGNTEAITSGMSNDHRTLMIRRDISHSLKELPDSRLMSLILALQEIESLLAYDDLDIEFAIDNKGLVHILQVRPIAVKRKDKQLPDENLNAALDLAHLRWQMLATSPPHIPGEALPLFGVMPDWNPAEIIGTAPGALAVSLYCHLIMDEVWATQRAEYGYRDVRPAPLLAMFAGHPYVDVRASFASFLPASLPDALAGRLLNVYLDRLRERPELHDKVEFEVVPTCLAPGFERWEQRLQEQGQFTQDEVSQLRDGLRDITAQAFSRSVHDRAKVDSLTERFDALSNQPNLPPLERARILLDDGRLLGTLPFAHLARSGFVAVTLLKEAVSNGIISAAAFESFMSTIHTVSHELGRDARAVAEDKMDWATFVVRYGHLRPGTYDVTSPRYDADPERFLRPLIDHAKVSALHASNPKEWHDEREAFCKALGNLGLPSDVTVVENLLRTAIEGREYAKFVFSRNLSAALEALAQVGETYGLDREQVSHLPLEELLSTRNALRTHQSIAGYLTLRAKEGAETQKLAAACELPPLLTRESELGAFILGSDRPNFIGTGTVTAKILDLSQQVSDAALDLNGKIVLIPQGDPGYDWLFGQGIAGLVTLYGGANSHMAIRAAEFGLPAAIGVGEQRYRALAVARVLELSPANSILRVVQ